MSQAIQTTYLAPTNRRGARIKAKCERGSITVPFDHSGGIEGAHIAAAKALILSFIAEDSVKYGTEGFKNPWTRLFVSGGMPDGSYAHVFVPRGSELVTHAAADEPHAHSAAGEGCRAEHGKAGEL